jgi:hypothetical protein
MVKQISVVFEILDSEEIEFYKKINEFAEQVKKEKKGSVYPKITGIHTKLIEEGRDNRYPPHSYQR